MLGDDFYADCHVREGPCRSKDGLALPLFAGVLGVGSATVLGEGRLVNKVLNVKIL